MRGVLGIRFEKFGNSMNIKMSNVALWARKSYWSFSLVILVSNKHFTNDPHSKSEATFGASDDELAEANQVYFREAFLLLEIHKCGWQYFHWVSLESGRKYGSILKILNVELSHDVWKGLRLVQWWTNRQQFNILILIPGEEKLKFKQTLLLLHKRNLTFYYKHAVVVIWIINLKLSCVLALWLKSIYK